MTRLTPDDYPGGRRAWLLDGLLLGGLALFFTFVAAFTTYAVVAKWGYWWFALFGIPIALVGLVTAIETFGTAWVNRKKTR